MHQSGDGFIGRGRWRGGEGLREFQKTLSRCQPACALRPAFVSLRCEGVMMTHVGGGGSAWGQGVIRVDTRKAFVGII